MSCCKIKISIGQVRVSSVESKGKKSSLQGCGKRKAIVDFQIKSQARFLVPLLLCEHWAKAPKTINRHDTLQSSVICFNGQKFMPVTLTKMKTFKLTFLKMSLVSNRSGN